MYRLGSCSWRVAFVWRALMFGSNTMVTQCGVRIAIVGCVLPLNRTHELCGVGHALAQSLSVLLLHRQLLSKRPMWLARVGKRRGCALHPGGPLLPPCAATAGRSGGDACSEFLAVALRLEAALCSYPWRLIGAITHAMFLDEPYLQCMPH